MANTILKADQIISAGLGVLERQVVLPGLVASDAGSAFTSRSPKNDTVSIRINGRTKAQDFGWRSSRSSSVTINDLNEFTVDVKLDSHPYSAIELTDEEQSLDIGDFTNQVVVPQTRAVAEFIEDQIADAITGATYPSANKVTIEPDGFYDAVVDARKALNDAYVPQDNRVLIVGTEVEAEILKSDQFKHANLAGDASALRNATIGNVAGMNVVVCNSIVEKEAYAFHKSAFQTVYRVPSAPLGGADAASGSYENLAMRWVKDYDSSSLVNRSIFDTFFGVSIVEDPKDYSKPSGSTSLQRAVKLTLGDGSP